MNIRLELRAGREYMMNRAKVVIIEDEPDIIEVMSYNLTREGFLVSASRNGVDGLSLVRN